MKPNNLKIVIVIAVVAVVAIAGLYWYVSTKDKGLNNIFRKNEALLSITINNCASLDPLFVEVNEGDKLYFINKDSEEHTITFSGTSIVIPGRGQNSIVARLIYGPGTYSYDCDESKDVGQLQINSVAQTPTKAELSFKELYDSFDANTQSCLRDSLDGDFENVYNNSEGPALNIDQLIKINNCSKVPE